MRRSPARQVRVRPGLAPAGLLLAALAAGCAPLQHSIPPYAHDAQAAHRIEARAAEACAAQRAGGALPPRSFTTDGCTLWPDSPWLECCVEHDIAYWCGGPTRRRAQADLEFRACVARSGHEGTAGWMYYAVRLAGGRWWPFPWRWGYGWDWPGR